MTLSPGTRFGPYEIVDAIGAGGMGEVYRATDTKLGREVAIKTLPSTLAADTDRLARFEREAKLLATLNHPNIAVIYDLDEHEGTQFIAMELIEGETLEEKFKDGPLPVEDTLRLALQIALALEAAHEKGVVHRDLKPANVMVTDKGQVKVLDFGLAKAFSEDPDASLGHSPALSLAMTQQGIVLGTASYMSPEQASGQATDQRADVWAFGVLLFEMLSGLPLFTGESVPHIMAAVLQLEPDWNRLPKNLHPRLKQLLERCLEKKVRNRYHSIADARIDIEVVLNDPGGADAHFESQVAIREKSVVARLTTIGIPTVVVSFLVGLSVWVGMQPEPRPVNRFDYDLPEGHVFRNTSRRIMALSPDGRHFVYNTTDGVYLRTMDELEARLIAGTEAGFFYPSFSPDGQAIAWYNFVEQQLKRVTISGGAPVVIADNAISVGGLSWAADGTILFSQPEGIYRVSANGGTPELVIPAEEGTALFTPVLLPDGDSVLFSLRPGGAGVDEAQILVQSLSTGDRSVLIDGGSDARYFPTGHLVYALGDALLAVRFDSENLTVSGGAVPLLQGVMRAGFTGAANYGVADDGTLVDLTGTAAFAPTRSLVWVDRQGREEPILAEPRDYYAIRLSPDGQRLAATVLEEGNYDIWVYDLERGTSSRLTFDPANDRRPVWTPDGERIVFDSTRAEESGLFWKAADGTGQVERLTTGMNFGAVSFSPDGMRLVYGEDNAQLRGNLHVLSMDGELSSQPLLVSEEVEDDSSAISPDGRWIAYRSDETGTGEIYVRPFPNFDEGK